jgi:hypothetical protein
VEPGFLTLQLTLWPSHYSTLQTVICEPDYRLRYTAKRVTSLLIKDKDLMLKWSEEEFCLPTRVTERRKT